MCEGRFTMIEKSTAFQIPGCVMAVVPVRARPVQAGGKAMRAFG
jgi:hypothetical protein